MRRAAVLMSALVALGGGGCGSSPAPPPQGDAPAAEEKLFQEYHKLLVDLLQTRAQLVEILAGIPNKTSMNVAVGQVARLNKAETEIDTRRYSLGAPPPAIQQRLQAEFGARLAELEQQRRREAARINALPGGPEFFLDVDQLAKTARP
jgi:hypothetical protein